MTESGRKWRLEIVTGIGLVPRRRLSSRCVWSHSCRLLLIFARLYYIQIDTYEYIGRRSGAGPCGWSCPGVCGRATGNNTRAQPHSFPPIASVRHPPPPVARPASARLAVAQPLLLVPFPPSPHAAHRRRTPPYTPPRAGSFNPR